jgi:diguanylate cyclase (GGDEF)-like protein
MGYKQGVRLPSWAVTKLSARQLEPSRPPGIGALSTLREEVHPILSPIRHVQHLEQGIQIVGHFSPVRLGVVPEAIGQQAMLDLDNFKKLNDTHGHQAGDEALRTFARTLRSALRESDPAARYGGEEFVVMLRATDGETATRVAEKIRVAVGHAPVELGAGRLIHVTVSIGVASTDHVGYDGTALLRLADRALYRAKQAGRNQTQLADPVIDASSELPSAEEESDAQLVDATSLV